MGNTIRNTKQSNIYYDSEYTTLDTDQIQHIRQNYKVIDVNWFDEVEVHSKTFNDQYFRKSPEKEQVVNNMLEFYLNDKYRHVYKFTDYMCDKNEKICICNTHAEDFRKIYEVAKYTPNTKYISWCKKIAEQDETK